MASLEERLLPNWMFKQLPTLEVTGGEDTFTIRSMVLLRRVGTSPNKDIFAPFVLHLDTLRKNLERLAGSALRGYFNPKNDLAYLRVTRGWLAGEELRVTQYALPKSAQEALKLVGEFISPNQLTVTDAFPLPGLQEVFYTHSIDGESQGKVTLYNPNPLWAEAILLAVQEAALRGDRTLQVLAPMLQATGNGEAEWVLSTAINGPILDVEVEEFPHRITITFGAMSNALGRNPAETDESGYIKPKEGGIKGVIQELCARAGILVFFFPPPGGPASLQGSEIIPVNPNGKNVRDLIEEYLQRAPDVRWHWQPGLFGGLFPSMLFVYPSDETMEHSFSLGQLPILPEDWKRFLFEQLPKTAKLFQGLGLSIMGTYNVLVPIHQDPKEAEWMSKLYIEQDEHGKLLGRLAGMLARGTDGMDDLMGPEWLRKGFSDFLREVEGFTKTLVRVSAGFNFAPILDVGSFRFRPPSGEQVSNPAYSSLFAPAPAMQLSAKEAVRKYNLGVDKDNQFVFEGPDGKFALGPNDPVYVNFQRDQNGKVTGSRFASPVPPGLVNPGQDTNQYADKTASYYPYEWSVSVPPMCGIWPGLPTYVVGLRPLDGAWQCHKVEYELSESANRLTVYLRTNRLPLYAPVVK